MSLFYQIVFILLIVEAGALSLLLAPLPLKLRKTVLVWLSKSKLMAQVRYVMRILFVFVTMLFIGTLRPRLSIR